VCVLTKKLLGEEAREIENWLNVLAENKE